MVASASAAARSTGAWWIPGGTVVLARPKGKPAFGIHGRPSLDQYIICGLNV